MRNFQLNLFGQFTYENILTCVAGAFNLLKKLVHTSALAFVFLLLNSESVNANSKTHGNPKTTSEDVFCVAGNTAPTINPAVTQRFCGEFTPPSLNDYVSSTPPNGTVLRWYLNANLTSVVSPTIISSPLPGLYRCAYWDEINQCNSPASSVTLNSLPIPGIPIVTNDERCGPGTVNLTAARADDGTFPTLNWYATPTSTEILDSGFNFSPTVTETTSFWVEATYNGCLGASRVEAIATVTSGLSPGTPSNGSACSISANAPNGVTTIDLDNQLVGADAGQWTITTDPSGGLTIGAGNVVNFANRPDGNYVFTYTTTGAQAPCTNQSTSVTIVVSSCDSGNTCGVSETEKQALWALYQATDGPNWTNTQAGDSPWDLNTPVCDWFGVTVLNDKITRLILTNNNLNGSIPNTIGDLVELSILGLANNQISGSIPTQIGNLTKAVNIYLDNNNLSGSIPAELGNLQLLITLTLRGNSLSGALPSTFGNLSSLKSLTLTQNNLTGTLSELNDLINLEHAWLWGNQFNGPIPELNNLNNLSILNLRDNNLTGSIPAFQNPNLRSLILNDNNLSGVIPNQLALLPELTTVDFKSNFFIFSDFEDEQLNFNQKFTSYAWSPQGDVDVEFLVPGQAGEQVVFTSQTLTSSNNRYQWWYKSDPTATPVAIGGLTPNKDLVLDNLQPEDAGIYYFTATNTIIDNLTLTRRPITLTVDGTVSTCSVSETEKQALWALYQATDGPNWTNTQEGNQPWSLSTPVCEWYGVTVENNKVTELWLRNNLVGTMPEDLGNLIWLERLRLEINEGLTGAIPASLGNLTNLTEISFFQNNLEGSIPSSLASLPQLKTLSLQHNRLTGEIPSALGNLSALETLTLVNNRLDGQIPESLGSLPVLRGLYLGNNQLDGQIPTSLGNLSSLEGLDLGNNQLNGEIPASLGNLVQLSNLSLNGNELSGEIPATIGNLSELVNLILSENQLEGSIPSFVDSFVKLQFLALDKNQFTGTIPTSLSNLTDLSVLLLDDNQIEGTIPLSLGNAAKLAVVALQNNSLEGDLPPGITGTVLPATFWLGNNKFVFSNLEQHHSSYVNKLINGQEPLQLFPYEELNNYDFAPQLKVDEIEDITLDLGSTISLTSQDLSSENNFYTWYKIDTEGNTTIVQEGNTKEYVITNIDFSDSGTYYFEATNSIVEGLTLTRNPITLNVAFNGCPVPSISAISNLPSCTYQPVILEVELLGSMDYENFIFEWNVVPTAQNGNRFSFDLQNSTELTVSVSPIEGTGSCSNTDTFNVEIYPGAEIVASLAEGVSCANESNGKATITITGQENTGYTEQSPFTITAVSPTGALNIGQQVVGSEVLTVENLPQGLFTITFQDNYGCTFEQTLEIPVIDNPIANFCTSLLPCDTTSGDVDMSFDMGNVHSSLNGTTYTASVKDPQGTELLNFTGSYPDTQNRTLTGLNAQSGYLLEITSANGCTYTQAFVVETYGLTVNVSVVDEMAVNDTSCSRNVVVDISNNISPCSALSVQDYEITMGIIDTDNEFEGAPQVLTGISAQTTFDDLEVGRYKIIVTPGGTTGGTTGEVCEIEQIFEVTPDVSFTTSLEKTDPLCAGEASGSAEVIINGGSGDFTLVWTASGSDDIIATGYTAINLVAGDYEVVVTDNAGCPKAIPIPFELIDPEALEVPFIEDVQTACEAIAGGDGGTVATGYTAGVAPYSFVWYEIGTTEQFDGSMVTSETLVYQENVPAGGTSVYSGITPGDYKVVVTDANGCTVESVVTTITQPEVPRKYHLALSWSSKVTDETESEQPGTRSIDPIGPSNVSRAIASQVERCIAETQEVAQENVAMILKDVDRLNDEIQLTYLNGASEVYHYTLYYYDRGGNLVRTVPPAGVNLATNGDGAVDRIPTNHTYVTGYDYNSIAQLEKQNTPDGGTSNFLYNEIGQLLYSQNERQIADNAFSYSIYDELGRIVEAGEASLNGKTFPDGFLVNNQADPGVALAIPLEDKVEYIQTTFNDRASVRYRGNKQRFLRNRVSHIYNLDKNGQETYTYYSYDPHGNVEWAICKLPGIGQTTCAYEYDLISGNLNEVIFNEGKTEEYRHKYAYDEDNRIISVKTSKDGYLWDEDARYDYYLHGPLARTELGEDRIQGLDFTYTIHGWLKGINTPDLNKNAFNPDDTNIQGDMASKHAKDEFGMALGYYEGDFTRDGALNGLTASNPFVLENQIGGNLYNGNISTWTAQTAAEAKAKNVGSYITGNAYKYDQLNRIKQATTKVFNATSQTYASINNQVNAFETNYSYDGNGNLKTLRRFKDDGQLMDDLTYHYDLSDPNLSNQLTHVNDAAGQVSAEINDLDNQSNGNYQYDAIGQLIRDESEGLTYRWNTSGKVSEIVPDHTGNSDTQKVHMKFTYDGMGNRVVKQVNRMPYDSSGNGPEIHDPEAVETTYYSLDAQGNVMGIYQREDVKLNTDTSDTNYTANFSIVERPMYGSDRVGQDTHEAEVFQTIYNFDGSTAYENVVSEFLEDINSVAYSNIMVAQHSDEALQATDGSSVTVTGTRLATAIVDGQFFALNYDSSLVQDANSTPISTNNNIFLIEDTDENPVGYGMVSSNYFNDTTEDGVMLIYDGNGNLIQGLQLINSDGATPIDPFAKSVVVRNPTQSSTYFLFYRDRNGGLHTATLSTASGSLQVIAVETQPLNSYGRHMAVVQDENTQKAYVYATTHMVAGADLEGNIIEPPQANLIRFTIADNGAITLDGAVVSNFESYDTEGSGELQVALDGSSISMYNFVSLTTQWTGLGEAEIRTWPLDDDWLPMETNVTAIAIGGNVGKGSLLNTGDDIYYTQRRQEEGEITESTLVKRLSDGEILMDDWGDLRPNKNNKFYYFAQGTNTGQEYNLSGTNGIALTNLPTTANGVTGYQPYQPYTVSGVTPAPTQGLVYRNVGEKYYELKDHLGNVRVVVNDRKNLNTTDNSLSANVVSYNNYYPFGMLQPGRTLSGAEGYRYGFQGQEKDDELKGEGNSLNYKYRMHDPRVGRFFSVDPLTREYPHYSPYSFSGNKVIQFKELEGAEELIAILAEGQDYPETRNIEGQIIEELTLRAIENTIDGVSTWTIKRAVSSAKNEIKAGKLVFSNGIEHETKLLHVEPELISYEGEVIKERRGVGWNYAAGDGVQHSSTSINQLAAQINKNKGTARMFTLSKALKELSILGDVISLAWSTGSSGELDPFALSPIPTFMVVDEWNEMTKLIEQDVLSEFAKAIPEGEDATRKKVKQWNHNHLKDFELFNVSTKTLLLIDLGIITEYHELFGEKVNPLENTPHVLLIKHDKEDDKVFILTRFIDENNLEQEVKEE